MEIMYHMQVLSPGTQVNPPLEEMNQGVGAGVQTPPVDIMETTSEIIYIFEIPGADQNAVNVEIRQSSLFVEGQTELGIENEGVKFLYRERRSGIRYSRLLSVPQEVDQEQAAASIRNGLLMVRFPKRTTGRRLNVNQPQHINQPQHPQHGH
ncbi:MAG: hypothetical protein CVU88_07285 [Firmicutes bacterium HGW-Firmicutes-13]|nr:MAG: hypothetical protein CVU88_07285 [Firmicutes bacterium HGW-Firmicutes-13]